MFRVDPEFDSLREALATAVKRLGIGGHYGDDPYGLADELVPYFVPVVRCEHGKIDRHWECGCYELDEGEWGNVMTGGDEYTPDTVYPCDHKPCPGAGAGIGDTDAD